MSSRLRAHEPHHRRAFDQEPVLGRRLLGGAGPGLRRWSRESIWSRWTVSRVDRNSAVGGASEGESEASLIPVFDRNDRQMTVIQAYEYPTWIPALWELNSEFGGPKFPQCEPTRRIRRRVGPDLRHGRRKARGGYRRPSGVRRPTWSSSDRGELDRGSAGASAASGAAVATAMNDYK